MANSLADIAAHAALTMSYRTAVKMGWTYFQRVQLNENHSQTKNNAALAPNKGKTKQNWNILDEWPNPEWGVEHPASPGGVRPSLLKRQLPFHLEWRAAFLARGKLRPIVQETLQLPNCSNVKQLTKTLFLAPSNSGVTLVDICIGITLTFSSERISALHCNKAFTKSNPSLSPFLLWPHKINLLEINSGLINVPPFTKATSQKKERALKKKRMDGVWVGRNCTFPLKGHRGADRIPRQAADRSSQPDQNQYFCQTVLSKTRIEDQHTGEVLRGFAGPPSNFSYSYRSASRRISSRFCLLSSRRRSKSISSMAVTCEGGMTSWTTSRVSGRKCRQTVNVMTQLQGQQCNIAFHFRT